MYFVPLLRVILAIFVSDVKATDSFTSRFAVSILLRISASAMKNDIRARSVLFPPIT